MTVRHFLTLRDLTASELNQVIDSAIAMKAAHQKNRQEPVLKGKVLAMIFEKSSTRTRVSFEAGMLYSCHPTILNSVAVNPSKTLLE